MDPIELLLYKINDKKLISEYQDLKRAYILTKYDLIIIVSFIVVIISSFFLLGISLLI